MSKRRLGFRWAWHYYDYKCQSNAKRENKGGYVKNDDMVCDHHYSIDYSTYMKIMRTYVKYLKLYLLQGFKYKVPYGCGFIFFEKNKSANSGWWKFVRNKETGKIERIRMKADHTRGYILKLKWNFHIFKPPFARYFNIKPIRSFRSETAAHINEDPSRINNFLNERKMFPKIYNKKK